MESEQIETGQIKNEQIETAYIQIFHNEKPALSGNKLNLDVVKNKLSGKVDSDIHQNKEQETDIIKVQFNPSTLSFSAHDRVWSSKEANRKKKTSLLQSGQEEVAFSFADNLDSSISVSFQLIFDKTTEKTTDVQPDVQQFLVLIQDPYVRQVAFCWGDLSYKGLLKNVEAEYVLFSALGTPTRATINLTLEGV
ncbi:MAG: hypothetical protein K1W16_04245 [Lachnospiraceae bacterium]